MTKEEVRKKAILDIYEGNNLQELGFRYYKSKNYLERKRSDFSFIIGFNSTKVNILDNTNIIIITASVSDDKFADWQKNRLGKYPSGLIGGGKIKNLMVAGPPYYDFDLTENENTQQTVIKEISLEIKSSVFKFFELCIEIERIIENINLPCFSAPTIIEYLAYKNCREKISNIIDTKSKIYPELKTQIDYYSSYLSINSKPIGGFKETYEDNSKLLALQIAETLLRINNS